MTSEDTFPQIDAFFNTKIKDAPREGLVGLTQKGKKVGPLFFSILPFLKYILLEAQEGSAAFM